MKGIFKIQEVSQEVKVDLIKSAKLSNQLLVANTRLRGNLSTGLPAENLDLPPF